MDKKGEQVINWDTQIVPEGQRDEAFKQLKTINKNNICIDCEKKNPKWASIHLGLHLCIDCAGKHRQYGVMYSFVKSINLDAWNQKQLLFMQKGGNARAIQYFKKCGILSQVHKHIDYKSAIVQKYKEILTAEVESELFGKPIPAPKEVETKKVKIPDDIFEDNSQSVKQIPDAEVVQVKEVKGKKKKGKKRQMGEKIDIDFDKIDFDDGVPIEEKDKIIKAYENQQKKNETVKEETETDQQNMEETERAEKKIQEPKQLTQEQAQKKLEELKTQNNVKNISSDSFKDNTMNEVSLQQNLNKFQGSQSISSNAFFGEKQEPQSNQTVSKIKDMVSDASGKLYNTFASYWKK